MLKNLKGMKWSILSFLFSVTSFSCQKQEKNLHTTHEQIIRVNNQGSLVSLHPHTGLDLPCRIFQRALFEGLTRINPKGEPELAAASAVDITPEKTQYTFHLRHLKWTNQEPVTAYHFEKAWKAALAPNSACLRPDLFYLIKNAQPAKLGQVSLDQVAIHAVDAMTLIVELEHPSPYFLDLLANPLFSPLYDDSAIPTVFNGPFRIQHLVHDQEMILEKNPDFWDEAAVRLKQLHVSFIPDATTALMLYEKKELDWVGHPFTFLPNDAIPRFESDSNFYQHPINGIFWLCLNTEQFPLNNIKIRKALSLSINRKLIAEHVLQGETPTQSIITTKTDYIDENRDRILAKKLFKEGLEELGLTLSTFSPLIFSHCDIAGQKKIAEAIQNCWEKTLGIKVHLKNMEWNTLFSSLGSRQYQIGGCIWFAVYNDPSYFLEFFKKRDHRYNAPQWENTYYQQLLYLADHEKNSIIREKHLAQAEMILLEEMPIIPLYVFNAKYLKSPFLKNLTVSDLGHVDFKWAYVEENHPH